MPELMPVEREDVPPIRLDEKELRLDEDAGPVVRCEDTTLPDCELPMFPTVERVLLCPRMLALRSLPRFLPKSCPRP